MCPADRDLRQGRVTVTIDFREAQRQDGARDPIHGWSGSRRLSNEERLESARAADGFKNTYLHAYMMRGNNSAAAYFTLPGSPDESRVIVFRGTNPWGHIKMIER